METIGERIKKKREEKGLLQADLAIAIKKSKPTVTNIENGNHNGTFDILKTLCEILDTSADYLLFGEERNQSEKDRLYSLLSQEDKQLIDIILERAKHKDEQNKKENYTKAGNL